MPPTTTTVGGGQTSSTTAPLPTVPGQVTTTTVVDRGDDAAAGGSESGEPPTPQASTSAPTVTGVDLPDVVTVPAPTRQVLSAAGAPLAGSLIHGLEIVLPPAVATVLASPLIVLELLLGTLLDSGGADIVPSLLLVVVASSILTPGPRANTLGAAWERIRGAGRGAASARSRNTELNR